MIYCFMYLPLLVGKRTSDGGNVNHSVSMPIILIKVEAGQMLSSSYKLIKIS